MLPFGSLLSHIPLLVLAFAYLIYFGASAVNKTASDNEQDLSINKVKVVKKATIKTQGRNLDYFQALKGNLSLNQKTFNNIYFQQLVLLPRYIPDKKLTSFYEGCNLFSRPPPDNLC
jgi:hypothetical protein